MNLCDQGMFERINYNFLVRGHSFYPATVILDQLNGY